MLVFPTVEDESDRARRDFGRGEFGQINIQSRSKSSITGKRAPLALTSIFETMSTLKSAASAKGEGDR